MTEKNLNAIPEIIVPQGVVYSKEAVRDTHARCQIIQGKDADG